MTSDAVRDQLGDHLLTPENFALVIIDVQPIQVRSIQSMDQDLMVRNVVTLTKLGQLDGCRSSSRPSTSRPAPTSRRSPSYDRTTITAWDDQEFRQAIKETSRGPGTPRSGSDCGPWVRARRPRTAPGTRP